MNCEIGNQPKATCLSIGALVKTVCIKKPDFASLDLLEFRREDWGMFWGYVPGTNGDLQYIKHLDGGMAVYHTNEVKIDEKGLKVNPLTVDFANEMKANIHERFLGKQLHINDVTQALRDMLVHKLTKEGWTKFQANKVSDSSLHKSV